MASTLNGLVSVDGTTVLKTQRFDLARALSKADAVAKGKPYWLPIVVSKIDNSTQKYTNSAMVQTITNTEIQRVTTVTDKTAQDISDIKDAETDSLALRPELKLAKLQLVGEFRMHQRLNVLEGNPAGGAGAFIAWLEAQSAAISDTAFKAKLKELLD